MVPGFRRDDTFILQFLSFDFLSPEPNKKGGPLRPPLSFSTRGMKTSAWRFYAVGASPCVRRSFMN